MKNYNFCEIINNINQGIPFCKSTEDGSLSVYVYNYIPLITLSIHSGEKMDKSLRFNLNLSEQEKSQTEEKFCNLFINDFPIKIIANESKLKYDLDKSLKDIINKELYNIEISAIQTKQLRKKHSEFYKILETLITKLLRKNKFVHIYDLHTFTDKERKQLLKIEFNQKINNKVFQEEGFKLMEIAHICGIKNQIQQPIAEDYGKLENSYLGSWIDEKFPNRVILTRINIKDTFFKDNFLCYDTSSLNTVRLIIKNLILLRHRNFFSPSEVKRSREEHF